MTPCLPGAARTRTLLSRPRFERTRPRRSPAPDDTKPPPGPASKLLRGVHLGKFSPPASGGIETHTRTLARAQAELGADVTVVVVNHATAAGKDVTFDTFGRTPF